MDISVRLEVCFQNEGHYGLSRRGSGLETVIKYRISFQKNAGLSNIYYYLLFKFIFNKKGGFFLINVNLYLSTV